STAADNQTSVEIHVLQGERQMASDNKTLGRFILDGIPPSPRGMPQVEVTFDIDANGILNVKARDKASGKEQHITITATTSLSKEEVEKMKADAATHAEEDKKKKELIEARNLAEQLVYTADKALKDAGDKVGDDVKKSIQEKIDALKKVQDGNDREAITRAAEELSKEMQKIGEVLNKMAQEESAKSSSGAQASSDKKDETVEGQYEEVKKDENK
ncbi:MAG: Hsp70 family protein, partial [Parcubacteria group bacterium]|nr:Hsp70 family protein [Parcubacteria group bacterium]